MKVVRALHLYSMTSLNRVTYSSPTLDASNSGVPLGDGRSAHKSHDDKENKERGNNRPSATRSLPCSKTLWL